MIKKEWRKYVRGNSRDPKRVIKSLMDLGAEYDDGFINGSDEDSIYFIDHDGVIKAEFVGSEMAKIIMDNYQEILIPEILKEGDILVSNDLNVFIAYKCEDGESSILSYISYTEGELSTVEERRYKEAFRLAKGDEIKKFDKILFGYNKVWDAENKKLISRKWIPKDKEKYYFINGNGWISTEIWVNNSIDKKRLIFNNVFKTKSDAENKKLLIQEL